MSKCVKCLKEITSKEFLKYDHRCKECNKLPNAIPEARCERCRHYPHKESCIHPIDIKGTLLCGCEVSNEK